MDGRRQAQHTGEEQSMRREKAGQKSRKSPEDTKGFMHFREKSLLIRELLVFGDGAALTPGGAGEGLLGLLGRP